MTHGRQSVLTLFRWLVPHCSVRGLLQLDDRLSLELGTIREVNGKPVVRAEIVGC
jgi:hypothetical protein